MLRSDWLVFVLEFCGDSSWNFSFARGANFGFAPLLASPNAAWTRQRLVQLPSYRNGVLGLASGRIIVVQFCWELDFVEDSAILDDTRLWSNKMPVRSTRFSWPTSCLVGTYLATTRLSTRFLLTFGTVVYRDYVTCSQNPAPLEYKLRRSGTTGTKVSFSIVFRSTGSSNFHLGKIRALSNYHPSYSCNFVQVLGMHW